MSIQVAIMASRRARPYVQHSLASLFQQDHVDVPVRVVVCDDNPDFVGPWLDDHRVTVEPLEADVWESYAKQTVYWKITETFLRCLRPAAAAGDGVVLLQDDVELARNWLVTVRNAEKKAQRVMELKRGLKQAPVVLALYCAGKLPHMHTPLAEYPAHRFYGNVGLYLSRAVIAPLVDFAEKHHDEMDDMILQRFLQNGQAHLFAVNPNIVQHTGEHSTHGGGYYRSPTFRAEGHKHR